MKKTIRLTESDLRHLIKESIKSVLTEGKTVNNKPMLKKNGAFNTELIHKLADRFFKGKDHTDIDSLNAFLDELSRYERMGQKLSSKRRAQRQIEDNMIRAKREREALIKMLRATDVSLKEYQHMSDEEREDLEDHYETLRFRESGWVNRDPRLIEPDRHRWNDEGKYLGCY